MLESVRAVFSAPKYGAPLRAVATLLGVYLFLREIAFRSNPAPNGVMLYGVIIGLLYAFIVCGLILVYRATRIINFAQAEIGAAAAVFGLLLIKVNNVPYLVALPLALGLGALCGFLVDVLVVRRFSSAPRLVLSVATIGLSLIFGALQLILPFVFGATTDLGIDSSPIETPVSGLEFQVDKFVIFDGNSIIVIIAAALLLGGLTAFFKLTDIGYAVRASAENADRALLLGIPVARVGTIVWMMAGMLSTLGLFLKAPLTGLPIGTSVGPYVLLYALAAAVIAKMDSFSTALLAAVALGITEQAVFFSTRDSLVPVAVTLPVLLGAMLLQRGGGSRGQDTGVSTWSLSKDFRFTPPELRSLPEVIWGRRAFLLVVAAVVLYLPTTFGKTQQILASVVVMYGIVAVSLVILTGWSGQISLGQWGFAGLGAAVAGGASSHLDLDFFLCVLLAGIFGAIAAVAIGLPALRIQGLFLAVTTLSFALVVQVFILNRRYFDWLLPEQGTFIERPLLLERYDLSGDIAYYYVSLAFLMLALVSTKALRQSRGGRLLIAVRDNQRGIQAYGVDVRAVRLWAFAISGFWAAIAGALFVFHQGAIDNSAFGPDVSLQLLVVLVIGGSTSLPGAMISTAYMGILRYSGFAAEYQLLGTGAGALILLMFFPGGLAQPFYTARDLCLRAIANRRGILVPSLVADKRVEDKTADEVEQQDVKIGLRSDRSLGSIRLGGTPVEEVAT